jgi:hypothetical protein
MGHRNLIKLLLELQVAEFTSLLQGKILVILYWMQKSLNPDASVIQQYYNDTSSY